VISGIFRFTLAQRALCHHLPRQRYMNISVSNVPGPPVPLYLAGAPLLEVYPVVPITGNMTLGIGVLSYNGQFNLTAVADRDGCPDVEVFAEGARRALDELTRSFPVLPEEDGLIHVQARHARTAPGKHNRPAPTSR